MPSFQDREHEIEQICTPVDQNALLNVYGEAGIGKSCLLHEAAQRLRKASPPALVLEVDLKPLAGVPANRPETALRALIAQSKGQLTGVWQSVEQIAGQVVAQLIELTVRDVPVVLMFDTTEGIQEDMEFWRWMEANLVGPLAVEGQVRQIFAGRVPVPWRRIEVRRALRLLRLDPLSTQDAARDLVKEVLRQQNPDLEEETLEQAIGLVMEFSFGHPLLSEKLAQYVAPRWPASAPDRFRQELGEQVVKPFIGQCLFDDIDHPWGEILWWASVLDWFDATILQRYLGRVDQELVEGHPDYFFIQGITRLRIRYTVVWREASGDRLHGVIADIVRHCLMVLSPDRYHSACQSAAETFEALASEFPEESPEAEQYRQGARVYRQRAKQEIAK
jgi:hypothetical protein